MNIEVYNAFRTLLTVRCSTNSFLTSLVPDWLFLWQTGWASSFFINSSHVVMNVFLQGGRNDNRHPPWSPDWQFGLSKCPQKRVVKFKMTSQKPFDLYCYFNDCVGFILKLRLTFENNTLQSRLKWNFIKVYNLVLTYEC